MGVSGANRIFPRADTAHYLQYMTTNYYDLLLAAWERRYGKCRQEGRQRLATAASNKVHLAVSYNFSLNQNFFYL